MQKRVSRAVAGIRWKLVLFLIAGLTLLHLVFFDVGGRRDSLIAGIHGHIGANKTAAAAAANRVEILEASIPADEEEYVAICLAVRDQAADLGEFLTHHYYHHGIRRFYIQDDGSHPPLSTFDYPIPSEAITFHHYTPEENLGVGMQVTIYANCQREYGDKHTWIAYFDADEFLETRNGETLNGILRQLEKDTAAGALAINWRLHTSAGYIHRQESVRKAYDVCIYDDYEGQGKRSDNKHVKSIVRTKYFDHPTTPHTFATHSATFTVGEDGKRYYEDGGPSPWRTPITRNRIALHHYAMKSRDEYEEKIQRGAADRTSKTWDWWNKIEKELPHVECKELSRYRP